jgi:hypothetical protein
MSTDIKESIYLSKFYNDNKLYNCLYRIIENYYNIENKSNDKYSDVFIISSKDNNLIKYKLNFEYNPKEKCVYIILLKKYAPEGYKFNLPLLAMCIGMTLTKYRSDTYKLDASQGHSGLECCLTCYYQKMSFQPIDRNNNPFKDRIIMSANTEELSLYVYNILSKDKICII